MTQIEVAPVEEFPVGERRLVQHDGVVIGVLHVDGEFYAIENQCAHDGGPVCKGQVHGQLVAEFDKESGQTTEFVSDELSIACPWHGWEYDLESGQHLGVDDVALQTYDVVVRDGTVFVEI